MDDPTHHSPGWHIAGRPPWCCRNLVDSAGTLDGHPTFVLSKHKNCLSAVDNLKWLPTPPNDYSMAHFGVRNPWFICWCFWMCCAFVSRSSRGWEPKDFVYLPSSSLDAWPILHAYGKHTDSAKSQREGDRRDEAREKENKHFNAFRDHVSVLSGVVQCIVQNETAQTEWTLQFRQTLQEERLRWT